MNLFELKAGIESGQLLGGETFLELNLDEAYDSRQVQEFEQQWLRSYGELKVYELSALDKELVDSIREMAFKVTYKYTEDSDLAAYVCDDFEVISKSIAFKIKDDFISEMLSKYKVGQIPGGS